MKAGITLCLIFELLGGLSARAGGVLLDRLEASVNSAIILNSDLRKFKETAGLRVQLDPQLFADHPLAKKGASATHDEIIAYLIDERLITLQFPVTDAEVEQQISVIQSSNKIDRATLKNALAQQGYLFEDYRTLIRSSTSTKNLVEREIQYKVKISEDDAKNYYYNLHPGSASERRSYQLRLLFVSLKSYKSPAAAREVAQKALQSIRSGEAFEEVAKRSSDQNAESGGDLGFMTEDQMSPLIREQAKKLSRGETSEIFGGVPQGGFYIVKVVDLKTDSTEAYEKSKPEIMAKLYQGEFQHQIALWLERQRQAAFIYRVGKE